MNPILALKISESSVSMFLYNGAKKVCFLREVQCCYSIGVILLDMNTNSDRSGGRLLPHLE